MCAEMIKFAFLYKFSVPKQFGFHQSAKLNVGNSNALKQQDMKLL